MVQGGCIHRCHWQVESVDPIAGLEVRHGGLGGAPGGEGREGQLVVCGQPEQIIYYHPGLMGIKRRMEIVVNCFIFLYCLFIDNIFFCLFVKLSFFFIIFSSYDTSKDPFNLNFVITF